MFSVSHCVLILYCSFKRTSPLTHLSTGSTSGVFHNKKIENKRRSRRRRRTTTSKRRKGRTTTTTNGGEEEETVMDVSLLTENGSPKKAAMMEAAPLPWPEGRRPGRGRRSGASGTESASGLGAEPGTALGAEPAENHLAQVFSPAVTVLHSASSPRGSEAFWEMESEKSPFLGSQALQDYNQHGGQYEWAEHTPPRACGRCCPSRDVLKVGVSLMTSTLLFPFLVWGGFVFLPFDAPLLAGAPLRLVYALRCSVFAAAPVVLGWLVLGVGRLRSGALGPPFDDEEAKGAEPQEVAVHRRFVSDSASLFLMYFLQLAVMAMYLSQEQLKLVPLLSVIFALGRLVYWVAAAFGSSTRGFGFGLSFLPSVAMMAANFYFIFAVEASGSIFSHPAAAQAATPPAGKQRFSG